MQMDEQTMLNLAEDILSMVDADGLISHTDVLKGLRHTTFSGYRPASGRRWTIPSYYQATFTRKLVEAGLLREEHVRTVHAGTKHARRANGTFYGEAR